MPGFVALLRGVNVGKANRVPMAELRELLDALGYTEVATLLNSGNAVFDVTTGSAAGHAKAIAAALGERLGVDVPVIVKSAKELRAIVADKPARDRGAAPFALPRRVRAGPGGGGGLAAIRSLVVAPERFALGLDAAYLLCAAGIMESKAGSALLGKAGKAVTTRNWATVLKLQALAELRGG